MNEVWPFAALFVSALTSATILPGTSEAGLAALVYARPQAWAAAWAVATAGNVLGSMISYAMGRFFPENRRPVTGKAGQYLRRYGAWSLLLAWVPLVGDALPLAAGWLRLNVWVSFVALTVGKAGRYAVLLWLLRQTAA